VDAILVRTYNTPPTLTSTPPSNTETHGPKTSQKEGKRKNPSQAESNSKREAGKRERPARSAEDAGTRMYYAD
jgi:hypothetical protein